MVKLNSALASRKGSKSSSSTSENFLKNCTHLYLQNKAITEIEDLPTCKNLTVLYLQNNKLENIENLQHIATLTHLYLQNNEIKQMKSFGNFRKLRKLYLGYNLVSVVEGLEAIEHLEELHLEKQTFREGHVLTFDPACLESLKDSLRVLVISGNNIESLSSLMHLEKLQCLRAGNNLLRDIPELLSTLQAWPQLSDLMLLGNPICKQLRYREKIIAASYHALDILDGKHILPITRSFLQGLAVRQESRYIQPCSAKRDTVHDPHDADASSRKHSLQLAISSQHCARLPDLPPESESPFFASLFPAWKSGKPKTTKPPTPEHVLKNWSPPMTKAIRRKSCSSTSTDLSQHLHISRL